MQDSSVQEMHTRDWEGNGKADEGCMGHKKSGSLEVAREGAANNHAAGWS